MQYAERAAPKHLASCVECVWTVWGPGSKSIDRVVPDGCPEIIVHLGDVFSRRIATSERRDAVSSGRRTAPPSSSTPALSTRDRATRTAQHEAAAHWKKQPRVFLAGTLTRPWLLRSGARVLTVGIRLRPGGFTTLFGGSLEETADREVALASFLAPPARRQLLATLRRARTTAARLDAAERWLVAHAKHTALPPAVQTAITIILKARGQLKVEEIAARANMSRRRLERAFLRNLGIGPKMYARIVRLNGVLAELDEPERQSAVDLALHAGYFDQAHLLRDFRHLAGRLPRQGRAEDGEMARHFTRPARLRPLFLGE